MSERGETNADRLEAIQRSLPPAKGVKSRLGYASLDEFAAQVGTTRQQLIKWREDQEPSERYRRRLAELSSGRYSAADFVVREPRTTSLAMRRLEDEVRDLRETVRQLEGQGRFLSPGEPGEYLSPGELAELREEGIAAEEGYGRTIRKILRTLDVVERRLRRLERLLPVEERGHG